jgi:peptidoglycan/xylan/chitin deacetylase (PgdA/CDA1 family)
MVRRSIVAVALGLVLFPSTVAFAQDSTAGQQPAQTGRTPRVPRNTSRSGEAETPAVASAAPVGGELGSTPPAPAGIARSHVRSHIDTDQQAIAFTLDDGYNPDHRILDLIEHYGVHGTAFIVGQVADDDPAFVRELVRLGWMVCSHTYTHRLLTTADDATIRKEMLDGMASVERVVGYRCPYFRAPYGSVDARVAAVADELGVQLIGWETSISDSAPKGTDPALQTRIAIDAIRPGSILLGHFGGTNSYTVLSNVFEWLQTSGYSVGSVAELNDGHTRSLESVPALSAASPHPAVRVVVSVLEPVADSTRGTAGLSPPEMIFYATGMAFLLSVAWRRERRRGRRPPDAAPVLEPL